LTVNAPVAVALPPSGLVTVTLPAPSAAPVAIEMFAVSDVALLNVVEFTVIAALENVTAAPETNPLPVIATLSEDAPRSPELGAAEVTDGPPLIVKTPMPVPVPPSGLVTVTLPAPVVALLAIVMLALIDVALLKVVELTVIPEAENATVAPETKPVPVIVMLWLINP
jgi:hypothetical protein